MPLPPSTIRIKRKRGDDSVDILRLQSPLLSTSDGEKYGYKRRRQEETELQQTPAPAPRTFGVQNLDRAPTIRATKAGDELHDPFLRTFTQSTTFQMPATPLESSAASTKFTNSKRHMITSHTQAFPLSSVQRRFHLMRSPNPRGKIQAGVPKPRPETFFMEHHTAVTTETLTAVQNVPMQSSPPQTAAPELSMSLQQIPVSGNQEEAASRKAAAVDHASPRFRPRVPALRYNERQAQAQIRSMDTPSHIKDLSMVNTDFPAEDDESAFVIDTFVRMPMEMLVMEDPATGVGLLVLDSQVDMEEFYNNASEDDSSDDEDEEDENAESHPFNDYPDDEVDSDDEYDRNPYLYRNRNASDEEEFDENEATFSDDDDVVGTTKSWLQQPPWMRPTRAPSGDGADSD